MPALTFDWIGGTLGAGVPAASLNAVSSQVPEGVYTTFRTYGGRRILRLDQHAARLRESALLKGADGDLSPADVHQAVAAVLDRTGHPESRLRLTFAPPRLLVSVEPFRPLPPEVYAQGVACVTVGVRRENPRAKDTRFIAAAGAVYGSLPPGVEEGLMHDESGAILEGLSSNFFAVRNGRLWTEEARVLLGVTRSIVLEVASGVLPVERAALRMGPEIEEAFLTSVSREVLPVVRVDGTAVGSGRPGAVTREIAQRFAALVETEAAEP